MLPFGVDFDRNLWFFVSPRIRVGRFRIAVGRSRWRDSTVVRLHYDVSALPVRVKSWLYDEVVPIDAHRWLGIGGVNAPAGRGEQFFFLLERVPTSGAEARRSP